MTLEQPSRKRQKVTKDSEDDAKHKRGRPRVEGQDETAADRRRTQIRLAQRAYRQRKENTISSLKNQVSSLQSTIEEMNKAFLAFNDRVVGSSLAQNNTDLARELKNTTERFLSMAKIANTSSSDSANDSDSDQANILSAESAPIPEPHASNQPSAPRMIDVGMGYVQILDEPMPHGQLTPPSDVADVPFTPVTQPPNNQFRPFGMRSTDFTLFPTTTNNTPMAFDNTATTNHQSLVSPTLMDNQISVLKNLSVAAPYTYSVDEITFARRLQRAGFERAFHLLAKADSRPEAFHRVFHLSLPYMSRDSLLKKLKFALTSTTYEPLEVDHTPFIQLGGAGTHYATARQTNGYAIKFGPNRKARLQHVETGLDPGIEYDIDIKDYEGEWYDSNDVQGFLEELGMQINPRASFAEATVSERGPLMQLLRQHGIVGNPEGQSTSGVWQLSPMNSPVAPTPLSNPHSVSSVRAASVNNDARLFQELGMSSLSNIAGLDDLSWASTTDVANATGWLLGSGDRTPEFLASGWTGYNYPSAWEANDALSDSLRSLSKSPEAANIPERSWKITLDVGGLIDYTISRGICLGRAPGFRKKDVEQAIVTSIIEVA